MLWIIVLKNLILPLCLLMMRFLHLECCPFHFLRWTNWKSPLPFHWVGTILRHQQFWLASGSRDWITSSRTIQRQNNTFICSFPILPPSVRILKKRWRQLTICLLYLWVQKKTCLVNKMLFFFLLYYLIILYVFENTVTVVSLGIV